MAATQGIEIQYMLAVHASANVSVSDNTAAIRVICRAQKCISAFASCVWHMLERDVDAVGLRRAPSVGSCGWHMLERDVDAVLVGSYLRGRAALPHVRTIFSRLERRVRSLLFACFATGIGSGNFYTNELQVCRSLLGRHRRVDGSPAAGAARRRSAERIDLRCSAHVAQDCAEAHLAMDGRAVKRHRNCQ